MVFVGGLAQFLMMPVIAAATLYLRHRRLPPEVAPSRRITLAVWGAGLVIASLMGYYVLSQIRRAF